MNRPNLIPLILSGLLAAGCSEPAVAPLSVAAPELSKAVSVRLSSVSLVVTVSDTDPSSNPYNIQSDGKGPYSNGSQNVQAILDASGTFAFNTGPLNNKNVSRWVTYNFNAPVDPTNTYRPNPSNTRNYHFSTGPSTVSSFTPIQNLGVNGNPSSECIYMGNSFENSATSWRVSYHKGLEDVSGSPTAFAFVTRTSVTPAIWTITPAGSCSANSNVAALRSGDSTILYGYYSLPFFFTLQAK